MPDLTLILDISVDDGLTRIGRRSMITDRFESLNRQFHQRLRDGFLSIAQENPERCAVIDASGDVETVHRAIIAAVATRLDVVLR